MAGEEGRNGVSVADVGSESVTHTVKPRLSSESAQVPTWPRGGREERACLCPGEKGQVHRHTQCPEYYNQRFA